MSHLIPEGIEQDDEIALTWERDEDGVKIVAVLGECSIKLETSYEGADVLPWLVASLPNILEQAWAAIEAAEDETPQEEA
jgi:hypothetical protein